MKQITVTISDEAFDAGEVMRKDRRNENRSAVVEDALLHLYEVYKADKAEAEAGKGDGNDN